MNETAVDALTVHGTNPQFLIEKITRSKIYSCLYWKEKCFGLTAETILDRAITLKYCGGCYGGTLKPSPFLCLVLKLLQLQPEKEIIIEFIRNDDFKYLRALGAFYLRLVGKAEDVYRYLEPLYNDYRKLSFRGLGSGTTGWQIKHMDEFIDELLTKELVCDIALPFLQNRSKLEDLGQLQPRKSVLDEELEFMQNQDENEESGNDDNDVVAFLDKVTGKENSSNKTNKTDAIIEVVKSSSSSSSSSSSTAMHNDIKDTSNNGSFDNREKRDENSITSKDRNYERDNDRLKSDNNGKDRERDRRRDKERRSRSPERSRRSRSRERSRRSRSRERSRRSRSRDRSRYDKRHDDYDDKRYRRRSSSRSHSRDRRDRSRDKRDDKDYGNRRNRSRSRSKDRYDKYEKPNKSVVNFDDDEEDGQVNETKTKEIEKANKKAAKKFDKIFGKKDAVQSSSKAEQGKVEEGSVEYWNQIRASLGIKALRE